MVDNNCVYILKQRHMEQSKRDRLEVLKKLVAEKKFLSLTPQEKVEYQQLKAELDAEPTTETLPILEETSLPMEQVDMKETVRKVFNRMYWAMTDGNQRAIVINGAKEILGDFLPRKDL